MTRITHMKTLPKNVEYWDYYIVCRLDDNASMVLQRMEYWDGTKADGNIHAEKINDQLTEAHKAPTQDTSRFIYKTSEELSWEMIGACNEKTSRNILDFLSKLRYLISRHDPYNTWNRTKQYAFQEKAVQEDLDRLYNIVKFFQNRGRQQRPVLYAIEQLTEEGVYVHRVEQEDGSLDGTDLLSIELVAARLAKFHEQMAIDEQEGQKKRLPGEKKTAPSLPTFIKFDLKKDEQHGFSVSCPSGNFTECIESNLPDASGNNDQIDEVVLPDRSGNFTGAISLTTTVTTNTNYKDNDTADADAPDVATPHTDFSSQEQPKKTSKPKATKAPREPKPKPDLFADVSPEAQAIITEWQSIFKSPIAITKTLVGHAETLTSCRPEAGEIAACRLWMYQTDKKGYYTTHGMHLGDVVRELERFRSLKNVPAGSASTIKKTAPTSQQMIQEKVPDFKVLSTLEVALMPPEQRKSYNAELRKHLAVAQAKEVARFQRS